MEALAVYTGADMLVSLPMGAAFLLCFYPQHWKKTGRQRLTDTPFPYHT